MKFKLNTYNLYLKHDKLTIISEFIETHTTEEFRDVFAPEPRKFPLM